MKKIFIAMGIIVVTIMLISIVSMAFSPAAKQSFNQGMQQGKQTVQNTTK